MLMGLGVTLVWVFPIKLHTVYRGLSQLYMKKIPSEFEHITSIGSITAFIQAIKDYAYAFYGKK